MQTLLKSKNGTLLQRAIISNISLSTNLWKILFKYLPGTVPVVNNILQKYGFLCRVCFISEEKKYHIATRYQQYVTKIYVGVCVESKITK
ncbi:hypothetical protein [Mucilaginibacter flavidus]|uniref:hypothetical protein n=1 Tax=Mucilaginibacter flavidus TaxID=2949309 RepID=UPI002093447F|nr:hypothetical protein [Mucilaginibacter flavidus]MCO5946828.1 hypothetical protein [Mucilaginibacter flavidus]